MIRRKFLSLAALTGAGGIATLSARGLAEKRSVSYRVQGFTCITCATGLETLLQREKGVLGVTATYPEGRATVSYDARYLSEADILREIESMGFKAQVQTAS